ncbi:MAG: PEGA domain-containing protein [Myxococcota bacterium]
MAAATLFVGVGLTASTPGIALAQETPAATEAPEPAERRLARGLRDQAYADLARERYAEGIAKLEEAFAAVPNPGLLLNVAIAYRRWGEHCSESLQALERFDALCSDERCPFLEEGRTQRMLLESSCTGEIRVLSSPVRARIRLDASPRGATPLTLRLQPGRYTLTATVAETGLQQVDLEVRPGQLQELRLLWPDPEPRRPGRQAAGWASAGVAVTGLLVGAIFTGLALDSDSALSNTPNPDADGLEARRDREWGAAAVGYGFAVGAGVTAAALLLGDED